jgi:Fe-S cluster assembly protein SufD
MQTNLFQLDENYKKLIIEQECENYAVFIGSGDESISTVVDVVHEKPHLQSYTLIKAVLFDQSRFDLTGNIIIRTGAKHTDAYLKISVLMLSSEAKAKAVPSLEIMENDVKGGHGATVGQVDPEELFYLQSRGLSHSQATKVLVKGFLRDLTEKAGNKEVQKKIEHKLDEILQTYEAEKSR